MAGGFPHNPGARGRETLPCPRVHTQQGKEGESGGTPPGAATDQPPGPLLVAQTHTLHPAQGAGETKPLAGRTLPSSCPSFCRGRGPAGAASRVGVGGGEDSRGPAIPPPLPARLTGPAIPPHPSPPRTRRHPSSSALARTPALQGPFL